MKIEFFALKFQLFFIV
uniref:Uncharacterized protein n=1 Tax=Rhizophora mucronata TaxID=61149 RepID=A0A2P2IVZ5_RHIMU